MLSYAIGLVMGLVCGYLYHGHVTCVNAAIKILESDAIKAIKKL